MLRLVQVVGDPETIAGSSALYRPTGGSLRTAQRVRPALFPADLPLHCMHCCHTILAHACAGPCMRSPRSLVLDAGRAGLMSATHISGMWFAQRSTSDRGEPASPAHSNGDASKRWWRP